MEVLLLLVLSNQDVQNVLRMPDCIETLRQAFIDLSLGQAVERPRSHTYAPVDADRYYLFKSMDGGLLRQRVHAIRMSSDLIQSVERQGSVRREKIAAAPGNRWVGFVMLFSMDHLEPLAVIQDGYLQRTRVGATSALAAEALVPGEVEEAGMIGSGWQAGAQVLGLSVSLPCLRRLYVFSRDASRCRKFCDEFQSQVGFELVPVDSAEAALRGRHFWVLATNALEPVADGQWLIPNSHINSIQGREVDSATLNRVDVVVVRHHERPSHWAPPGFEPAEVRASQDRRDISAKIVTLGDVLTQKVGLPREGITLFAGGGTGGSAGLGIQFAAVAHLVYQRALAKEIGRTLPSEWFTEEYTP